MNDDLRKVQQHIKAHQDEYVLLGLGVVMGLTLSGIFRRKPKVDEAAIIAQWADRLVEGGFNIYMLTNEQKALWESTWAYAMKGAEIFNMSPSEAMASLTKTQLKSVAENFQNLRAVV